MRGPKTALAAVVGLYLAIVLNQALPDRIDILGARPDFVLVVISCLGLLSPSRESIFIGFAGGVMQGAISGANMAQYAFSRTIGCYLASKASSSDVEFGPIIGAAAVGVCTLLTQIIYMFGAPPSSIQGFIRSTIEMALYNFVLALPIYAAFSRLLKERRSGV